MTLKTSIFLLTVLFSADTFAQCCSSPAITTWKVPPLQQDTTKTITINSKKYFVFADTNRTYIYKWNIADTSLYDGNWVLLSHNNPNKILLQITYKNKLIDGKVICKRDDGTLLEEWNYNNGKLDGQQKTYFKNGQIDELKNYKNGLKDGEQKSFHSDGSPALNCFYINGKPDGVSKLWQKDGRLWSISHYDKGKKQGEFITWDENGRITSYENYKDDLPIGIRFGFLDGKPTFESYYEDGKLTREVLEYYTLPKEDFETKRNKKTKYDFDKIEITIKKEAIYKDTIIILRTYYQSGQLQSEEPVFYAGEKDCEKVYKKTGTHKFWTADGKLEKELHYKDDKLIEK